MRAIWKETYRGRAIYWHGRRGYGDETNALYRTLRECRAAIDEQNRAILRGGVEEFWDSLTPKERDYWRGRCWNTELTAPQLAFSARFLTPNANTQAVTP